MKIDGKVARHVDRDDMVRTVFETFNSLTVGCAQCHNHKFDPVTMEDYYSLHAVFASIDRADREYDVDPQGIKRRQELTAQKQQLETATATLRQEIQTLAGDELALLDKRLAELNKAKSAAAKPRPEFGYHSQIEKRPDVTKWVQVDHRTPTDLAQIVIVGCHDDFNGIGAR